MVAAERHFDPRKAQVAAAALMGGGTALLGSLMAPALGIPAPPLLSVESAFWAFLVASAAGKLRSIGLSMLEFV